MRNAKILFFISLIFNWAVTSAQSTYTPASKSGDVIKADLVLVETNSLGDKTYYDRAFVQFYNKYFDLKSNSYIYGKYAVVRETVVRKKKIKNLPNPQEFTYILDCKNRQFKYGTFNQGIFQDASEHSPQEKVLTTVCAIQQ